jgi:L-ascorbate metabolism protein UlaG (beta-lactamase superfamily)
MKIQWLGHSSFLITSDSGTRIVTDPYDPTGYAGEFRYKALNQPADVVTISHEHRDHFYPAMVKGSPIIIKGAGRFIAEGIEFVGTATAHDDSGGSQRGKNTVFTFTVDGVRVCHLGDLGHVLNSDQAAEIGAVDVLLCPVGGYYTIGPDQAWEVAGQLAAKIVIPMHFKTPKLDFPITGVDDFLKGKENVTRLGKSAIETTAESLPKEREIIVLDPAL